MTIDAFIKLVNSELLMYTICFAVNSGTTTLINVTNGIHIKYKNRYLLYSFAYL